MRNKKIEKTNAKKKQSYAQNNIYMVRQFAYIHGIARISLLSRKYIKCGYSVSVSQKDDNNNNNNKTLIIKNGFYILRTGFTMGYKKGQKFFSEAQARAHMD